VLARELAFGELREVPGQEAGPDRVRVSGGVDSQQAAIGDVSDTTFRGASSLVAQRSRLMVIGHLGVVAAYLGAECGTYVHQTETMEESENE
jgi:hypothetical protein